MKIQINWKVALVLGLVTVVGITALNNPDVAIALIKSLSGIITSLGSFTS